MFLNPLSAKKSQSKAKVTLCACLAFLITSQFQSPVILLSDIVQKSVFMSYIYNIWHLKD